MRKVIGDRRSPSSSISCRAPGARRRGGAPGRRAGAARSRLRSAPRSDGTTETRSRCDEAGSAPARAIAAAGEPSPASTISPASGRSSPPSRCRSVDLPLPERPSTATTSPASTSRATPSSTRRCARPRPTVLVIPRASRTGTGSRYPAAASRLTAWAPVRATMIGIIALQAREPPSSQMPDLNRAKAAGAGERADRRCGHARPRKPRAGDAVAFDSGLRRTRRPARRLELDQELAIGMQQRCDAGEQSHRLAPDPDVAVEQQRAAPSSGARQFVEDVGDDRPRAAADGELDRDRARGRPRARTRREPRAPASGGLVHSRRPARVR